MVLQRKYNGHYAYGGSHRVVSKNLPITGVRGMAVLDFWNWIKLRQTPYFVIREGTVPDVEEGRWK